MEKSSKDSLVARLLPVPVCSYYFVSKWITSGHRNLIPTLLSPTGTNWQAHITSLDWKVREEEEVCTMRSWAFGKSCFKNQLCLNLSLPLKQKPATSQ